MSLKKKKLTISIFSLVFSKPGTIFSSFRSSVSTAPLIVAKICSYLLIQAWSCTSTAAELTQDNGCFKCAPWRRFSSHLCSGLCGIGTTELPWHWYDWARGPELRARQPELATQSADRSRRGVAPARITEALSARRENRRRIEAGKQKYCLQFELLGHGHSDHHQCSVLVNCKFFAQNSSTIFTSPCVLYVRRHKRDKKKITLKKRESRNLAHQYNDEFAQFTLSS